ncbi:FG-GAP repeat domain-containing protein [Flagellimonas algicola]|uniref:VCBS repeat-containing protein n=1 Tax=Flagellimonas algicola TaxID=2583815 RepID=A0ABY2WPI3_9FLAO|nr:VCBS repeat-containing protein [Allomuricauda algicola]TMU56439.1 VCBS repeat-containing protein [Allomuricauda algicola]
MTRIRKTLQSALTLFAACFMFHSCAPEKPKREVVLYQQYCASCHMLPKIEHLPKDIWKNGVLPDMLSRMEIEEMHRGPTQVQSGFRPKIKLADWLLLENYILDMAPEELEPNKIPTSEFLDSFEPRTLALDNQNGALISYLQALENGGQIYYGDIQGNLSVYDFQNKNVNTIFIGNTPITWYNQSDSLEIITEVGILDPSEQEHGKLISKRNGDVNPINHALHRPVHTLMEDLNSDGNVEMVVSEFGDETGQLSILIQNAPGEYQKQTLLNQPGCIRTLSKDMDKDGKLDLITLTSQGNESITVLYQMENLKFRAEKVLEFSPVYGSSWFELVDYNMDGYYDIITVNGDNADKSYVHKPYHGMRIHLNDGTNSFSEAYFYPLYGATRLLARDFDQDGDLDFGLISSFPDYENAPELSFVYLDNLDAASFDFSTKILENPNIGRWFLMDALDTDQDGDEDIVLSSFTYVFTPVPETLSKQWEEDNVDLLILENKLIE